jgi:hypothetical protein
MERNNAFLSDKIISAHIKILESCSPISPAAKIRVHKFITEFSLLIDNPKIISTLSDQNMDEKPSIPIEIKTLVDVQQAFLYHIPSSHLLPASLDLLCTSKMEIDLKSLERQAVKAMETGDLDRADALFKCLSRCSGSTKGTTRMEMSRLLEKIGSERFDGSMVLPVEVLAYSLTGVCLILFIFQKLDLVHIKQILALILEDAVLNQESIVPNQMTRFLSMEFVKNGTLLSLVVNMRRYGRIDC